MFKIREVADDEAQQPGSAIALMQNLLPAVPVLLLGFLCLEGKELVSMHCQTLPVVSFALFRRLPPYPPLFPLARWTTSSLYQRLRSCSWLASRIQVWI